MNHLSKRQLMLHSAQMQPWEKALQRQMESPTRAAPGTNSWRKRFARAFVLLFAIQTVLTGIPGYAQVVAAPGAPSGIKPIIDAAANGVPLVHIAPPSAAGVSRNQYSQFNVPTNGLILNNSTSNTSTQLGGWVTPNLQLGTVPARIILNEVTSTSPSSVRGYIEVAGQKADIVIANPNGITCDGCGFLNTLGRATLTTGATQLGADGGIQSFNVGQGVITVGKAGLNAANQEQLDLIARGMVIEGEVWAKNLNVIAGTNKVLYGTLTSSPRVTPQDGGAGSASFAIDIKELGGMYANQVFMIATEKGLGVNSTGRIAALQGNLSLSANGDLTVKDSYAKKNLQIRSTAADGNVKLTGTTLAEGSVQISATQQIENSGTLQSKSSLEIDSARIVNTGNIALLSGTGNLVIAPTQSLQNSGEIYAGKNLQITTGLLGNAPGQTGGGRLVAGQNLSINANQVAAQNQEWVAGSNVTVKTQSLTSTGGLVKAGDTIDLQAQGINLSGTGVGAERINIDAGNQTLNLQGGQLLANSAGSDSLQINAKGIVNIGGQIISNGTARIDLQHGALDNRGGTVSAATNDLRNLGRVNNAGGTLHSTSDIAINGTDLNNSQGTISTQGSIQINTAGQALNNEGGTLKAQGNISLQTGSATLQNSSGIVQAGQDLRVETTTLNNQGGSMRAGDNATVTASQIESEGGVIVAGKTMAITTGRMDVRGATLSAGSDLQVNAGELDARATATSNSNLISGGAMRLSVGGAALMGDARLSSQGPVTVQSAEVVAQGAVITSGSDISVGAGGLQGGNWVAGGNLGVQVTGQADISGGALIAGGGVQVSAQGIVTNNAFVSGTTVNLDAGQSALSNQGGSIKASGAGTALTVTAQGINNTGGSISSQSNAVLNAGSGVINNTQGSIDVAGGLTTQASSLVNQGGSLSIGNDYAHQGALDNSQGRIRTGGDLTINTQGQALNNQGGNLIAQGKVAINADVFNNTGGSVVSTDSTKIQARQLDANAGLLISGKQLDVQITAALSADSASLQSGGAMTVNAATINANNSRIGSGGAMNLTATSGSLLLDGAKVLVDDSLVLSAQSINANGAQLGAKNNVQISASNGNFNANNVLVRSQSGDIAVSASQILAGGHAALVSSAAPINGFVAGGNVNLLASANRIDVSQSTVAGQNVVLNTHGANSQINNQGGNLVAKGIATLTASTLNNQGATIDADGAITLSASNINNDYGVLHTRDALSVANLQTLTNQGGSINTSGGLALNLATLNNQGGAIVSLQNLDLTAASLNTSSGVLAAKGNLTVNTTGGSLMAGQSRLSSEQGSVTLTAGQTDLTQAQVLGKTNVTLNTQQLTAASARVESSQGAVAIAAATGNTDLSGTSIQALNNVTLQTGTLNLSNATLGSGANIAVTSKGAVQAQGINAAALGTINVTAAQSVDANAGQLQALGDLSVSGQGVNLAQAQVGAKTLNINAGSGQAETQSARLFASATVDGAQPALRIQGQGVNNTGGQIVSGAGVSINATTGAINNQNGTIVAGTQVNLQGGAVNNSYALIASNGDLSLAATGAVDNSHGKVLTGGNLSLQSAALTTTVGQIHASGASSITITSLQGAQSSILAGQTLTINTQGGALDISQATVATNGTPSATPGAGALTINAGNTVANGARVTSSGGLSLSTGNLQAVGAELQAQQAVNINAQVVDLTGGTVTSASNVVLTGSQLDLTGVKVNSQGNVAVNASSGIQAQGATVGATGSLSVVATQGIDAGNAVMQAGTSFGITGQGINLNQSKIAADTVDINALSGAVNLTDANVVASATTNGASPALRIQGQGVNSQRGQISSGADLSISAGSAAINNQNGQILAVRGATLQSQGMDNTQGAVLSNGNLSVNAGNQTLDNRDGTLLSTSGNISAQSGDLLNSRSVANPGASISAGGDVSITAAGQIDNAGSAITAGRDLTLSATGVLDNSNASLLAARDLSSSAASVNNTGAGRISASGNTSLVATTGGINNATGLIQASGNLNLQSAGNLNNAQSQLLAGGNLTLQSAVLDNTSGQISADAGSANLTVNQYQGQNSLLAAGNNLTVNTQGGQLDARLARLGTVGGVGKTANLNLSTGEALLDQAIMTSSGDLTFTATRVQAPQLQVQAAKTLTLTSTGEVQAASSTFVAQTGSASLSGTTVNLQNASVSATSATGNVLVNASDALNAQNATVQAGTNVTLSGLTSVDMNAATITAGQDLSVTSGSQITLGTAQLNFGRDVALRGQGVNVNGLSLTGRNVTVDAGTGTLNNANGTLSATGSLTASGATVDNTAGQLAANGQANVNATGAFNNRSGTVYSAQSGVNINAGSTNNRQGSISASGSVAVTGGQFDNATGSVISNGNTSFSLNQNLNNSTGTITAQGILSVSANGIDNKAGTLFGTQGASASAGSGVFDNRSGGTLSTSQGAVSVAGADIYNTGGVVQGQTGLSVATGGTLDLKIGMMGTNQGDIYLAAQTLENTNSQIRAQGNLIINAGNVNNFGGVLGGNSVSVASTYGVDNRVGVISGTSSTSIVGGSVNNDQGVIEAGAGGIAISLGGNTLTNTNSGSYRGIVSSGSISINAGTVDNQGGYVGSSTQLSVSAGNVANQGGTLLGLGGLNISATGNINNSNQGSIKSAGNVSVNAGSLDNQNNGTVFAGGDLSVTTGTLNNSNTQNAFRSGLLANGNLSVSSTDLNNQNGAIVAMGNASVVASNQLDNRHGQIAGTNVSIDAPTFLNTGGRVDAQNALNVKTSNFSADGVIASNGTLDLTMGTHYTNTGTVSAVGSLRITTSGDYINQGTISATNSLSLTAANLDNQASGSILAQSTTLNVSGTLNNAGLINASAGATTITAGSLNNTGRIYGDSVTLNGAVSNSVDSNGTGAVIASRGGNLTVNGSLDNIASVLSLGSLAINGNVKNNGGVLNAMQNVSITGNLNNTNANLVLGTTLTNEAKAETFIVPGSQPSVRHKVGDLIRREGDVWRYITESTVYPSSVYGIEPKRLSRVTVMCGSGMDATPCGDAPYYTDSDPVWALFKVPSPSTYPLPALPAGVTDGCATTTSTGGMDAVITTTPRTDGACGGYWTSYNSTLSQQSTALDKLDTAISAFNTDLCGLPDCSSGRNFLQWFRQDITSRETLKTTANNSAPGQIFAGGSISLSTGVNQDSIIIAGGAVSGGIDNRATDVVNTFKDIGTLVYSDTQASGGGYRRNDTTVGPLELTGSKTDKLDVLKYLGNQNVAGPGAQANTAPTAAANAVLPTVAASASLDRSNANNTGGGAATIANRAGTAAGALTAGSIGPAISVAGNIASVATNAAGSTTVASGGRVNAGTSTNLVGTATPGSGPQGTNVAGVVSGNTPGAGSVGAPGLNGTNVTLSAAGDTPLPGSILAASLRQGQSNSIGNALTSFATSVAARPLIQAPVPLNYGLLGQVRPVGTKDAGYSTATLNGRLGLGRSQLFRTPGSPNAGYLIETDPAFTNQQQWLGSDYFLAQLNLDPERTLKRYGDGFAEQRLVDDQIMALTGKRYLSGYNSTQEAYQALMDSGALYAKEFQLTPGIALSAQQMASLTSDIVWLERQTVTLADGSTTEALVPRVYLRKPQAGDLQATGTLVSGADITLRNKTGTLTNTGTLYANGNPNQGQGQLTLSANNLNNSGQLVGHQIDLTAKNDINNVGGSLQGIGQDSTGKATSSITARAGGNILLQTTTIDSSGRNSTRTQVDRIATVQAGNIALDAGKNIVLAGAQFNTDGKLTLKAGQDIKTVAVIETSSLNVGNARGDYFNRSSSSNVQTNLGGNNVTAVAGRAITLTGANIAAINDVTLVAQDITISAAVDSASADQKGMTQGGYNRSAVSNQSLSGGNIVAGNNVTLVALAGTPADKSSGNISLNAAQLNAVNGQLLGVATGDIKVGTVNLHSSSAFDSISNTSGLLSSKSSTTHNSASASEAAGSSVGGNSVLLSSGNNIQVTGSDVIGNTATTFIAKNDVTIEAAQSSFKASNFSQTRESGLMSSGAGGGGIGFTIGNRNQSADAKGQGSSAVASTVGTIKGDLTIQAGGSYQQTGSDVTVPAGDANISAKTINILEARETSQSTSTQKFEQSGITVSLSTPMLSTMQSVQNLVQAAGQTKSDRSVALAGAAAALTLYNAANPPKKTGQTAEPDASGADAGALSVSISAGSQSSQSTTNTSADQARGSSIVAGGNLNLTATGAGDKTNSNTGNITIQGSNVKVAGDANFDADGHIKLLGATNTHSEQSTNSSSSSSIGVSFGIGSKGAGPSVTVAANQASGQGQGSGTTYTDTQLDIGNTVTLKSGGDTTIKGAVVNATTANATVGGNLSIESVQASNNYTSSQTSSGGSLTVGTSGFGATASASKSNIDSSYQSTDQTSGIKAGDGGFNVSVAGNTTLIGGVITSTQKAVDDKANSFQTGTGANGGTLTLKDLANSASFNASSQGGTIGIGSSLSATSIGVGNASGNAASITQAGISGVAGNTAARTGDAGTGIKTIFNKDEVQADVNGQVVITGAFGQQGSKAVGTYAQTQYEEAKARDDKEGMALWAEGGAARVGLHAVVGALGGGVNGATGAITSQVAVPVLADLLAPLDLPAPVKQIVIQAGSALIGGATGGTSGAASAVNATGNNYLSHADATRLALLNAKCKTNCTAAERAELNGIVQKDINTTQALDACVGSTTATCNAVREDFNTAKASYLPTSANISVWATEKAQQSGGKYTAAQLFDAYRAEMLGIPPVNSTGDLSSAGDYVREQIRVDGPGKFYGDNLMYNGYAQTLSGRAEVQALTVGLTAVPRSPATATNGRNTGAAEVPLPKVTVNAQGITEVTPTTTPYARQVELNTPDIGGSSRLRPAEAAAAAQLEPVMGTMERYTGPPTYQNKSPDFVITSGPNTGQKVDMMYTTGSNSPSELAGMNKFFEKNMTVPEGPGNPPPGVRQIQEHFDKADTVVIDFRTLTPQNQQIVTDYIKTLPPAQQHRVVIVK